MRRKMEDIPVYEVSVPKDIILYENGKRYVAKSFLQKQGRKKLSFSENQSLTYAFANNKYNTITKWGIVFVDVDEPNIGVMPNILLKINVENNFKESLCQM